MNMDTLNKWLPTALFFLLLPCCCCTTMVKTSSKGGSWELLLNNSGVVAMHMALTHRDTVVIFDQTSCGRSGYRFRTTEQCPDEDIIEEHNGRSTTCWAHSVEYDVEHNALRPLFLKTDTWCSSGALLSNGTLVQTGGHGDGYRKIRRFCPCNDGHCGWTESEESLADRRWYATSCILPEKDRVFVVGGLNVFTYEFVPKSSGEGSFDLPFLRQTRNRKEKGDNLYPFVHLSSDGHLFIFANRDSILFDYRSHRTVKSFPRMPGGGSRSYPATGSSVILPLDHADEFRKVEVMVCGGGAEGAYRSAREGEFLEALSSCGRMTITDDSPSWAMEDMPGPRLMSDMLVLPTGDVLIVNGATHGCAGWWKAKNPSYSPYLYKPKQRAGERFSVLNPSSIPRMYHSSAILLPDGRVLVAGSNPNRQYTTSSSGIDFSTELRMEAFTLHYMARAFDTRRATDLSVEYAHGRSAGVKYGEEFVVTFGLGGGRSPEGVVFHAYSPPFATHSLSMSQRLLRLACGTMVRDGGGRVRAVLTAPPSPVVAPSGYYLLTVVNDGIPSTSKWVRFIHG